MNYRLFIKVYCYKEIWFGNECDKDCYVDCYVCILYDVIVIRDRWKRILEFIVCFINFDDILIIGSMV